MPAGKQAWQGETLLYGFFSFHAVLVAGLIVVAVFTVSHRFNNPDLWIHLKLGQVIWMEHSIPTTDTFSFTAYGHPWVAHEWLAQLGIYGAYRAGGYPGLMLCFAAAASLLFTLVYVLCYQASGSALAAFAGAVCAWLFATVGMAIRPLLLGNLFLAIELIVLEAGKRNRRWFWALPPLFAIWVNCHGSYFFGLGVLFLDWICSCICGRWGRVVAAPLDKGRSRQLGAVLVLCGIALCCNPVGVRLLTYPLNTLFQQTTGMNVVEEWLPPDLRSGRTVAMIAASFGVLLIALLRDTELRLRDLLIVASAFALATQHARMLFVFGIVVSPVLCRLMAPVLGSDPKREHPIANALLVAALGLSVFAAYPDPTNLQQQIRKTSPTAAVDYIRHEALQGPLLNEYEFGNYLIWALPEHKVFIDGRGDVYDWTGVFPQYARWATLKEGPSTLLDRHGIRLCLLATDSPLGRVIPLAGWRKVYSDEVATVFVR
jgi:hypothetical protein